jgi:hypothetical protein
MATSANDINLEPKNAAPAYSEPDPKKFPSSFKANQQLNPQQLQQFAAECKMRLDAGLPLNEDQTALAQQLQAYQRLLMRQRSFTRQNSFQARARGDDSALPASMIFAMLIVLGVAGAWAYTCYLAVNMWEENGRVGGTASVGLAMFGFSGLICVGGLVCSVLCIPFGEGSDSIMPLCLAIVFCANFMSGIGQIMLWSKYDEIEAMDDQFWIWHWAVWTPLCCLGCLAKLSQS